MTVNEILTRVRRVLDDEVATDYLWSNAFLIVSNATALLYFLSISLISAPSPSPKRLSSIIPLAISPSLIFMCSFEKLIFGRMLEKISVPLTVFLEKLAYYTNLISYSSIQ